MIKAVIFDFGNVICRFDNRVVLTRVAERSGKSVQELEELVYQSSDFIKQYERGLATSHEFFRHFSVLCDLEVSEEDFIKMYTDKFTPIPETMDLIRRLKGNYRLGLLSNTSEWDFEYGIKMTEVFSLFDSVTLSFRVHALKPEPDIYRDAVSKLGVPPEECVYVDDIDRYADAARELGMTAIQYRSPQDLLVKLKNVVPL